MNINSTQTECMLAKKARHGAHVGPYLQPIVIVIPTLIIELVPVRTCLLLNDAAGCSYSPLSALRARIGIF